MNGLSILALVASISFIAGAGLTYVAKTPWPSDMANQPSIKPQEGPMLPPQGSVSTDMTGSVGAHGNMGESPAGHQEMGGHGHGASDAAGHQHDGGGAKDDHGSKEKAQGMGHQQHGASDAGGHQQDGAAAKHDLGTKTAAPSNTKDARELPTDLLGSAGTGPGKTIQSPAGKQKSSDKDVGAHEQHSSSKASQSAAKASQHQHADGTKHDHGAVGAKPEKNKSKAVDDHSQGAGGGHSHGGSDGHAGGHDMQASSIKNPIKPTEASVKTGHKLFNVYCAVCHGNEGRGGAPMANKLAGIPKFTAELLRGVDDNHMFSMVTSGHGPMPGYAEALSIEERWHVANYVRTLQNKLTDEKTASAGQGVSR